MKEKLEVIDGWFKLTVSRSKRPDYIYLSVTEAAAILVDKKIVGDIYPGEKYIITVLDINKPADNSEPEIS